VQKPSNETSATMRRRALAFAAVVVAWIAIDRASKLSMDVVPVGTTLAHNVLGLFDFTLVHNTGGAWGVFGGSTVPLGIFSVAVCAALAVFLFAYLRNEATWLETISVALIVAGGLGNAWDRFAYGYVVDFFNCTFIDFPVFNVADIGVTCGIALLVIALIARPGEGRDDARAGED
jgi:signal peptidase II